MQKSRIELRDPNASYNKYAIADFSKTTPYPGRPFSI